MRDNQFSVRGFSVWLICAVFFLYEFFLRTVLGTFQHPIMLDLQLNSMEFSLLSATMFMIIYGIMQIPAGLVVDNFGLKKTLMLGCLACTLSSFGFANATSYWEAMFFRALAGFGASFGFLILLISVYDWMPRKYNAIFIGLSQFIGTMGPVMAAGPLDSLIESCDLCWRFIFTILGIIGLVLFVLALLLVQNNQQKAGNFFILNKPEKMSVSLKRLFARGQPWFIAIFSAGLYFSLEYLSENEGRAFLELKGVSANSASYMLTNSWIGYAIGCPLLGFVSDMIERRKMIMVVCAAMGALSFWCILITADELYLYIAFFFLGIATSGQTIGFACMAEQFKHKFIAVGYGLNNAMITCLSAINAPVIGLVLDQFKDKQIGLVLSDYTQAFYIIIALMLTSFIVSLFFIKETFAKNAVELNFLKNH